MGATSTIEWTDASWTPLRARVKADAGDIALEKGYDSLIDIATKMQGRVGPHCEHASPGCANCYSETNNARCLPSNGTGLPFDRRARDLVDPFLDEKILMQPLHWRAPRKVFVCSQTDLFGEWVPDEMIDRVFAVMALSPQHTFQVLTKRADRMREYASGPYLFQGIHEAIKARMGYDNPKRRAINPHDVPLPNVWLGVSVEDQQRADERIPHLLQTPAAVRFLSVEPLLGPVSFLRQWLIGGRRGDCAPLASYDWTADSADHYPGLDWVIVGGESGPGARPLNPDWVRSLRDQCQAAGVPFFFKQWGAWAPCGDECASDGDCRRISITGLDVTGNMDYWQASDFVVRRIGKKAAGRLLDGREWNELPEVTRV